MTARLLSAGSEAWPALLRAIRHDVYHLPRYVETCALHDVGEPLVVLVERNGGQLLLPIIARDTGDGGRDAASPYGYPGPLLSGGGADFERDALAEGVDVLREAGFVSLFLRYHPLLNGAPPTGVGTAVRQGETVVVDLSLPEQTLWQQTRANHRRNINRARRLGYTARMDPDWACYPAFKRLYAITMDRISASPFYRFDDRYFEGLRIGLGDAIHLAVVEKGGDVAAAGLYTETGGIVEYHLSGYAGEHADAQPTKLLMDFVRRWAKARGNDYLHLGGGVGARRDSLFAFKQGFSPLVRSYWTVRIVIDEPRYRALVAAHDAAHAGPGAAHDIEDRELSGDDGYFPLYRAPA